MTILSFICVLFWFNFSSLLYSYIATVSGEVLSPAKKFIYGCIVFPVLYLKWTNAILFRSEGIKDILVTFIGWLKR